MRLVVNPAFLFSDQGDGAANEDTAGYYAGRGRVDLWMIDGATPVTDVRYVPGADSDASWYAGFLSSRFSNYAQLCVSPSEVLKRSIADAREAYTAIAGPLEGIPRFAWPLAAVTYVSVTGDGGRLYAHGLHFGDCPVFLGLPHGTSRALWDTESHLAEQAQHASATTREQATLRIQQRRAEQHADPASAIAGFDPVSVDFAEQSSAEVEAPLTIVLLTDGTARLYKEYALMTSADFIGAASTSLGAASLLPRLRHAEAEGQGEAHYKQRDDATLLAVAISLAKT